MKKLFTLILILNCQLSLINSFAQAPEKMSYQSVIRNSNGLLLGNQSVGIRIKILQGAANGDSVYVETHSVTTNANGLATLEIGGGNVAMGSFANIDWSDGPYFLKTETDPNGGTNYTITGVNQLLSVPYSLYAKEAETIDLTAGENRVINYYWSGDLNGNNPADSILTTNFNWKGNRRIIVNGTVHVEFVIPQEAIDHGISAGTAMVDLGLIYNGQLLSLIHYKDIGIGDEGSVTLPFSSVVPNSVAGTSMQFSIAGPSNESFTFAISDPPFGTYGPYPIDMKVSVILTDIEL